MAVELGVAGTQHSGAADSRFAIEIDVAAPSHHVPGDVPFYRERLTECADISVHRTVHIDGLTPRNDVALHAAIHCDTPRPGDQITVDVAIDDDAIGSDDEICFHLLAGGQRVV